MYPSINLNGRVFSFFKESEYERPRPIPKKINQRKKRKKIRTKNK